MNKTQNLSCLTCFMIFAGLSFIGVFIWKFPSTTAEWASWVQAFGSIGAIGAAVFVLKKQAQMQRELQEIEHENQRNFIEEERLVRKMDEEKNEENRLEQNYIDGMNLLSMKSAAITLMVVESNSMMKRYGIDVMNQNQLAVPIKVNISEMGFFEDWNDKIKSIDANLVVMLNKEMAKNLIVLIENVIYLESLGKRTVDGEMFALNCKSLAYVNQCSVFIQKNIA